MHSDATSVEEYLTELEDERRAQIEPVLQVVRDAMPAGYAESISWGMPSWSVPLETFPDTYNGQPLSYVGLAAQKRHNALYLLGLYSGGEQDAEFRRRWTEDGHRLDMGKSCLRYRTVEDLRLDLIRETVASITPAQLIALHERARAR